MTSPSARPRQYRAHLLALEPRMMFDAAAAVAVQGLAVDAAGDSPVDPGHREANVRAPVEAVHDVVHRPVTFEAAEGVGDARFQVVRDFDAAAIEPAAPTAGARELIFIDTSVADYRALADAWAGRGEVVLIDGTRDGIDQLRGALAGRSDVAAIHIVGHGEQGLLWLGTTRVDADAIAGDLSQSLGAIGRSLAAGGDILIYGCDFAEGQAGADALAAFAAATHADVAASTDTTGFAPRGGDWVLEARSGTIEARTLDGGGWAHTLDPNVPVPISVQPGSLTVYNAAGTAVFSPTLNNYNNSAARSPDVGTNAYAVWANAATFQGRSVDLKATIVTLSAGDAVQFNRVTGTGTGPDDPTFLLRDLTTGTATPASVQIRWELVDQATGAALPANVRFTIADIDGIGGNPNTRETVTASTDRLAYYTRERVSDIHFTSALDRIVASGTENENEPLGQTLTSKSAATFDWSDVSAFTLTYTLTPNAAATQAQFFHDGDADFVYTDPVYVSVPRLDLDGDDSTAAGNDAHFTFTENGPGVPVVDADVVVSNPMDINSVMGATVTLTNYRAGDGFTVGTLPGAITATVGAPSGGRLTVTLSGAGSERDYAAALKAIRFANGSDTPDTTQRVIEVAFSNDTLTSAVATSRIDVVPANDAPVAVDDTATVAEDGAATIAVLANDRDPDGDPLTITAAGALHGTVVRNSDGTLRYTPDADYNGADTISYTITDGRGGSSSAQVAVTVTPVNDAPAAVGSIPASSTADGAAVSIATAPAFADRDGDALRYTADGLPAGLAIDAATGVISGTVDRSASQANGGRFTVTVTATDPGGATATQRFTLDIANPAPVARDDAATTAEDTPVTIAVLANDTDPDGDPLTVTGATAIHGQVTVNADGTLTYTPDADFNGSDTISYTVADGQGGTASATVAVTVTPVNDAPRPKPIPPSYLAYDGSAVRAAAAEAFVEPDGDQPTYAAAGLPAGLSIDPATGVISGRVDRSASQVNGGRYAVTLTATDASGATGTQRVTLFVLNPAPTARNDAATVAEDGIATIAVLANDTDPDGDPLAVTGAAADHGRVVVNADGTLTYTPDADYNGADTIRYTISDREGGTSSASVAVTVAPVNDAPVAAGTLPPRAAADGETVSYATAPGFADVDGDRLTYAAAGLPAGLLIDAATGMIAGTLDRSASRAGPYAVTVSASDPSGAVATQAFALTVTNPAPDAVDDAATTHADTAVAITVLANDTDPDGDPLRVTGATAARGSVAVGSDGRLTYTPPPGFFGRDTVTYTITDGEGGADTATVTIDVVNAAPVSNTLSPITARDGEAVTLPLAGAFRDPDGDALRFSATGLPPGLAIDPATGVVSGTVDRAAGRAGSYDATITATDPYGATTGATLSWTITNPGPSAADDRATTAEDSPVTIAPLANDGDPDGDPLTIVAAEAMYGHVTLNADGTITYTPDADFTGEDAIRYTIDDGDGGRASASVAVTVTAVNDAPTAGTLAPRTDADHGAVSVPTAQAFADVDGDRLTYSATGLPPGLLIDPATGLVFGTIARGAAYGGPAGNGVYAVTVTATDASGRSADASFAWTVAAAPPTPTDDRATIAEDTAVTIPVLANDTDPDGDALTIVAATAAHGSVRVAGDALVFTPDPDFTGEARIDYTVADPSGRTASASVTVTVEPVNDAPVAAPLPAAIARDGAAISLAVGGFFRDAEGDPLTFAASGLPAGLSIDPATGVIAGIVARDASRGGVYHVVVSATDPSGGRAESTFVWVVVNPAPVAGNDAATVREDQPTAIAVLANDRDPDGDPLTIIAASAGHGSVAIGADGTLLYTPERDFAGQDVIVYTVADGDGGRASASVLVTVAPVEDAPIATPPAAVPAARDGAPVAIDAAAWFRDPDGDALTYAAAGLPAGLSIDPATGAITGTLDRSASQQAGGRYPVTVTARDPAGATASVTVELTVANPAPVARDDVARTAEDTGIDVPVLVNDADPDGDPLTVIAVSAANGSATVNADGSVRYVPGANFAGADALRYTISDGQGGIATATVTITVDPVNDAPVIAGRAPIDAVGGRPVRIDALAGVTDAEGDPLAITAATSANGVVTVGRNGLLVFTPALGFAGTTTITYTVSDGRGGVTTGTIVVRVADGRGADIEQLLRIGRVTFRDPPPAIATVSLSDGIARNPLSLLDTAEAIRSLNTTRIGDRPVGDAVEAIRTLRGTGIAADQPIAAEVARLDALRDQRDAGDRLFDHRWGDFLVKGLTGFSAAADRDACVMVESVVRGGAIYLEVRDIAEGGAAIRSVDVRLAGGGTAPDWIRVDPRGLAIIERGADMDELHLIVRVTRENGRTTSTPVVVQGATGEIELDRASHARGAAPPLDATLTDPAAAVAADAARLFRDFQ